MRLSRCFGPVAVAAAVAICTVPSAAARSGDRSGGARLAPAHVIHGMTGGELVGAGFAQFYGSQVDEPPQICPMVGRRNDILRMSPTGEISACTVKPGTPIYINGMGNACSDVEPEPFFGEDAAAQAACTWAFLHDFVLEINISVDGRTPVNIRQDRFEFTSPQMTVVLPEDNLFGLEAGTTATLVAGGYLAVIRGLTPGLHRIVSEVVSSEGDFTSTLIVNVVPGA
jgi:hypothetical protein